MNKEIIYNIEENDLIIVDPEGHNHKTTFQYPIYKIIQYKDVLIVLLDKPTNIMYNENIYGVNDKAEIIWKIEKHFDPSDNCPYVNIYLNDEKVLAWNWCCIEFEINYLTGKIIDKRILK